MANPLSWGFTHPYDALPEAPQECWDLYNTTTPTAFKVASHTPRADLERIWSDHGPAITEVIVRMKMGPTGQNTCPMNAATYQEWPGSDAPTAQDCIDFWLERGVHVTAVHFNEIDIEMARDANNDDDRAASFAAYQASWDMTRLWMATNYQNRFLGGDVNLSPSPLSQGDPDRFAWWFARMQPIYDQAGILVVHCYTNGLDYDDPDWGGQWRQYRARYPFPERRLIIGETNDNGALYPEHPPSERGQHIGGYAQYVLSQPDGPDTVLVFEAPRTPGGKPWWATDLDTGIYIALAIDLEQAWERRAAIPAPTPDTTGGDTPVSTPEAWTRDQLLRRTFEWADALNMPRRMLLGLFRGEAREGPDSIDQFARRPEQADEDQASWPDVSGGVGQQTVRWSSEHRDWAIQNSTSAEPYPGETEIERVLELYYDAEHAIEMAARDLAGKWASWGPDQLETLCRYNSPNVPGVNNRNRANYQAGLTEADSIIAGWTDQPDDPGGTPMAIPSGAIKDLWKSGQNQGGTYNPEAGIEKFYADHYGALGPCVSEGEWEGEPNSEGKPCMYRMFASGKAIRWDPLLGASIVDAPQ